MANNQDEEFSPYLRAISILGLILMLAAVGYTLSGFRYVRQHEAAIIYKLGKINPSPAMPGIVPTLPAPFGHISVIPIKTVSLLKLDDWKYENSLQPPADTLNPVLDGYALVGGVNLIQGRFQISYRISSPVDFEKAGIISEKILTAMVYKNLTTYAAKRPIDELLGSQRSDWLADCLNATRQEVKKLNLGLEIDSLELLEISPPAAAKGAFDDVSSAQLEADNMIKQALSEASRIVSKANAEGQKLLTTSQARREQKITLAKAWVGRFSLLDAQSRIQPDVFAREYRNAKITEILRTCRLEAVMPSEGQKLRIIWKPQQETQSE